MKKIGPLLILCGFLIVCFSVYKIIDQNLATERALAEARSKLTVESPEVQVKEVEQEDPYLKMLRERTNFAPQDNDVVGVLSIPKIEAELPIIEGTDEEMLDRGVGHYRSSAYPLDAEQILLSGHRDTVFRRFGELEIGDRFTLELPYGTFEYEMREYEIVDEDDTTVIRPMGEEVLTISTCYPFRYIGNAPQRYVVYAYPVEE